MNNHFYLFVYGTLLEKHTNPFAQLLKENAIKISKGFIYAKKYDLGEFPGIKIDHTKSNKTYGELFKISSNQEYVISELDTYEGFDSNKQTGNLFTRRITTAYTKHQIFTTFVYEYDKDIQ